MAATSGVSVARSGNDSLSLGRRRSTCFGLSIMAFPVQYLCVMQSLIDCAHHRCADESSWANRPRRSDNIADEPGRMPVPDGHSGVTASCSRDCIANKREPPDHTRPGFSRIHQDMGAIRSRTAAECPDFLPKLAFL